MIFVKEAVESRPGSHDIQTGKPSTVPGQILTAPKIPVDYGPGLKPNSAEAIEANVCESGDADKNALAVSGPHAEPWMNVLEKFEPGSVPAIDHVFNDPLIGKRIRGKVVDFGAGTCWLTARLSALAAVDEVVAVDLSQRFLQSVGVRMIQHWKGVPSKIRFAVASFNDVPYPDGHFDCGFFVAALHHSTAPLQSLMEARRVLKTDGTLIIVDTALALRVIEVERRKGIEETRNSKATELRYTKGEWIYMLEHTGFKNIQYIPLDSLTRNPVIRMARQFLRKFDLERLIFSNLVLITAQP
jgi:SAM-dependent methyltransferase